MKQNDKENRENNRDEQGKFTEGVSGNPNGRPKGIKNKGGLGELLKRFHEMVNKEENTQIILEALEGKLKEKPIEFYVQFIQPQLPKIVETGRIGEFINQEMKKKAEQMTIDALKAVGSEE